MFNFIARILFYPLELIAIGLIYFYKFFVSDAIGSNCAFTPSCSTYVLESIKKFGLIYGGIIGAKRLIRCNPKNTGGFEPVPLNLEGDYKWIC